VIGALDALNEGLERRKSVASARSLLELMQDTAHVMSKVPSFWPPNSLQMGPFPLWLTMARLILSILWSCLPRFILSVDKEPYKLVNFSSINLCCKMMRLLRQHL
jgi:hypothetical protein